MNEARSCADETVRWGRSCYCPTPPSEERSYWEEYFDLVKVQDAHDRRKCRDENGSSPGPAAIVTAPRGSQKS